MKKLISLIAVIILATSAFSQPYEKKGKDILDKVALKIKTYKTIKIEFSYMVQNKDGKVTSPLKDGVILIKGDKYHLTIPGQIIICDGKTIWTYLKDAKEVQINSYDPANEDALNPQKILTTYSTSHKPKFIKEEVVDGKGANLVDLEPLKGKSYFRIRMAVDKVTNQLISSTVYQKSGDRLTYKIKKLTPDTPIADTKFVFNKAEFPGVEIIDMR